MLVTHDPKTVFHAPFPNYTHAVEAQGELRWTFVSGQVGVAPDGTTLKGFEAQCRQAFENIRALLEVAGMGLEDAVMVRYYLIDRGDLDGLRRIRKEIFGDKAFAQTLLFVSGLASPDWLVEVDVVAARA